MSDHALSILTLLKTEPLGFSDICRLTGLYRTEAKAALAELASQGKVERRGRTRGTKYHALETE